MSAPDDTLDRVAHDLVAALSLTHAILRDVLDGRRKLTAEVVEDNRAACDRLIERWAARVQE